jgi:hypothetical protein
MEYITVFTNAHNFIVDQANFVSWPIPLKLQFRVDINSAKQSKINRNMILRIIDVII